MWFLTFWATYWWSHFQRIESTPIWLTKFQWDCFKAIWNNLNSSGYQTSLFSFHWKISYQMWSVKQQSLSTLTNTYTHALLSWTWFLSKMCNQSKHQLHLFHQSVLTSNHGSRNNLNLMKQNQSNFWFQVLRLVLWLPSNASNFLNISMGAVMSRNLQKRYSAGFQGPLNSSMLLTKLIVVLSE